MRLWEARAAKRMFVLLAIVVALVIACWLVMVRMPGRSFRGPLPPLTGAQRSASEALRRDVHKLAVEIGHRNVYRPAGYRAAAEFIENSLREAGLPVNRQTFAANGESCVNLVAEVHGSTRAAELVVVGAHYDSVLGSPAANDNGSGVAALLALARTFAASQPTRTLRFVAFANEEPPFFKTDHMGSLVYARQCRERGDNIVAMLSLETIGFYSDAAGSQKYPFPIGLFYPSRGNFIGFVGKTSQAGLVRRCVAMFRRHAQFPSEGAALPACIPGIDWSDHWAFWQADYPALMVTDTAPFRYRHYHTDEDTPDKLDYDRTARVVAGLEKVIEELANP